jgi:hypothetical protein
MSCFVLDSRLQSGVAGPPKRELRSRLGIYVGKLKRATDKDYDLAKTWLFPEADSGDIAMQTNTNIIPTDKNDATFTAPSNNPTTARRSGYQKSNVDSTGSHNVHGISNEDFIQSPFSDSVNKILPQMQDENSVPPLINLKATGLR